MWLEKRRIAQVLKDNDCTVSELALELGLSKQELQEILEGKKAANRRQAQILLTTFGIWSICWAMQQNERWMPYAIQAILAS